MLQYSQVSDGVEVGEGAVGDHGDVIAMQRAANRAGMNNEF
jgi:hypothetical protein